MLERAPGWLFAVVLFAAVVFVAPKTFTDPDTLSRLATGRQILAQGEVFDRDPFTFARPDAVLGQPEWLGDVIAYSVYERFGQSALQGLALGLVGLGFALALGCGVRLGARVDLTAALLIAMLPASAARIAVRNDIHALWLAPLFAFVLLGAGRRTRPWLVLLGLGALWANLHASFVLGWALLLAALFERWLQEGAPPRLPLLVVALYPALPLLGPGGTSAYVQLVDHLLGSGVYRAVISEWRPPHSSPALLALLPLYVFALLGAASFALARPRPRVMALAMFVIGTGLALGSRRFLPLAAVLAVPAIAGAGCAWLGRPRGALRGSALAIAAAVWLVYVALAARSVTRRGDEHVLARSDGAQHVARFIAGHAPAGARSFNAFNDGPWLLWLTAPRVRHYIDPRNHLGAAFLSRYLHELLPHPERFERESARLGMTLALVRTQDPAMRTLARHLSASRAWRLVYWDDRHALHARVVDENRGLLERFGYRVLRPTLDLGYLGGVHDDVALDRDFAQLGAQSAPLAAAVQACLLVRLGARELDPAAGGKAAAVLEHAIRSLPPSPHLLLCWAAALEAAGRSEAARAIEQRAREGFGP